MNSMLIVHNVSNVNHVRKSKSKSILYISACLLLLLNSCKTIQPVEFSKIDNFNGEFSMDQPEFGFDVHFYNPNKVGVKITQISSILSLNGKPVGNFTLPLTKKIEPKTETSLPVKLKISREHLMNLIQLSPSFLLERSMEAKVNGQFQLKKFLFKKKIPFVYSQKIKM